MSETANHRLVEHRKCRSSVALIDADRGPEDDLPLFIVIVAILNLPRSVRLIGGFWLILISAFVSPADAYQLAGAAWPQPTTTFYVDIPGAEGLWNRSFETAMSLWGEYTVFKYQIVREVYEDPCDQPEGRNGVRFMATDCEDAWGNGVLSTTHLTFRGDTLVQADIVFNGNLDWNVYSTSWQSDDWAGIDDFQRVAVHELGHALGLGHEDGSVSTIMASHASDITIPQQDDIEGVAALYATPPSPPPPPPSGGGGGGGCFISMLVFG